MGLLKLRLPIPTTPLQYYEESWDYAGEVGLAYQDLVRSKLHEEAPFQLPLMGRLSLKIEVTVYLIDVHTPQPLSQILEVLVDACTFAEVWDSGSIPLDMHIKLGGRVQNEGYLELIVSNSKIAPIDLIDGGRLR